ncbi:hypothetical protein Pcar_3461 [Syntrophotalea carbinolica DSM 2380]|uniref:Uncharacterized protein n=1 Tax=Syntrophotalea carbinolica (strain DSM 2380 / NBRC 103641 / GraBd1) TaxID=338963 RepID=J9UI58_SYNC1|nr:hypothetical protein [Syntrophotalea carbinolica]AFR67611.1 hypothetical protein Pcar_3461 [Syntrophotalea carbinolica DSM 2380]
MRDFRICPKCQYGRGFHVSLHETDDGLSIMLICPDCGQSYILGWRVEISGGNVKEGPVFPGREKSSPD